MSEDAAVSFVESINALESELERATIPSQFDALHQQLKEHYEIAKTHYENYERLADIWRGAEFNLAMFLRGMEERRRRMVLANIAVAPALPTSIPELIARINNEAQKQALQRLRYNSESSQMMYLAGYDPYVGRATDVEGTFTILGTMRNGSRESYAVKWYRLTAATRHSFWCNCPDHKFNSGKKNMVCKHICFLVARVGRIMDPGFFDSKIFTEAQQESFREVVGNAAIFADGTRERERLATTATATATPAYPTYPSYPSITATVSTDNRRAPFMECRKPICTEDTCPICYDNMIDTTCLSCPTCSNNIHRECMEVWLERNRTCVYCRSSIWHTWN